MPIDIGKSDIRIPGADEATATEKAVLQVLRELPNATEEERCARFSEIVQADPALSHEVVAAAYEDIVRELKEEEDD